MDRLAADAIARDPARFRTLIKGRAGIGGFYDAFRFLRETLRGRAFRPEHQPDAPDRDPAGPDADAGRSPETGARVRLASAGAEGGESK
jgi:hypothetical protein